MDVLYRPVQKIKLKQSIRLFMVKFQKNVRPAYCEEKKILRYIWTRKVQKELIYKGL